MPSSLLSRLERRLVGLDYERAFTRLCHLRPLTEGRADEALNDVTLTALVLVDRPVVGVVG